ncbi:MAG: hypothetical protein WDA13_01630 [Candidatus Shapirobacteria bacterium]
MNNYTFKKFENQGPTKDNRISINKSGEITFPSIFCYENKIFRYEYATLFWDQEKKAVGISFTNKKEGHGNYKVTRLSRGGGARISSNAFLKSSGIDLSIDSGRFSWKKYNDPKLGLLFVFELREK